MDGRALTVCPSTPAERNLNPKAACLKRREEEKGDEIPHHLHPAAASAGIPFNMNVTNVSHAVRVPGPGEGGLCSGTCLRVRGRADCVRVPGPGEGGLCTCPRVRGRADCVPVRVPGSGGGRSVYVSPGPGEGGLCAPGRPWRRLWQQVVPALCAPPTVTGRYGYL